MKIVVTGGAGFIGSNLVRAALADSEFDQVTVIDDLSNGLRDNIAGLNLRFVRGSILDPAVLETLAGHDAVVHLAALGSVQRSVDDPVSTHHANATGALLLLEAARRHGVGHVILAGSSSVYGSNPELPKRELTWTRPMSPYAASKLAAEAYTLAHQESYGLPALAFRFFNVYGPYQRHDHVYAAVIPRFVHAALRGRPVEIYGDGTQSRDFTYVGSVCQVVLDALRRRVHWPQPVNLAFGSRVSLLEVVDELADLVGHPIGRIFTAPRPGDVAHSMADDSTLRLLFPGMAPVDRSEGLKATVEWMAEQIDYVSGSAD